MSRIPKFRAWNKHYKEMYSHEELIAKIEIGCPKEVAPKQFVRYDTCLLAAILGSKDLQERYDLIQFTGLLDKNGADIYEGDIIILNSHRHGETYREYYVVVYDGDCFCLKLAKSNDTKRDIGELMSFLHREGTKQLKEEIVGNIHRNPEIVGQL